MVSNSLCPIIGYALTYPEGGQQSTVYKLTQAKQNPYTNEVAFFNFEVKEYANYEGVYPFTITATAEGGATGSSVHFPTCKLMRKSLIEFPDPGIFFIPLPG